MNVIDESHTKKDKHDIKMTVCMTQVIRILYEAINFVHQNR